MWSWQTVFWSHTLDNLLIPHWLCVLCRHFWVNASSHRRLKNITNHVAMEEKAYVKNSSSLACVKCWHIKAQDFSLRNVQFQKKSPFIQACRNTNLGSHWSYWNYFPIGLQRLLKSNNSVLSRLGPLTYAHTEGTVCCVLKRLSASSFMVETHAHTHKDQSVMHATCDMFIFKWVVKVKLRLISVIRLTKKVLYSQVYVQRCFIQIINSNLFYHPDLKLLHLVYV